MNQILELLKVRCLFANTTGVRYQLGEQAQGKIKFLCIISKTVHTYFIQTNVT